ncbi:TolC family protein [Acetobacter estunensis]|uniref:TolC family protein n=1 Tax=Acetobacter estunensis TaxID=104097 RepID=UPI0034A07CA7
MTINRTFSLFFFGIIFNIVSAHADSWTAHVVYSTQHTASLPFSVSPSPLIPFRLALDHAWARDPYREELRTHQNSALKKADAAHSWFAGGPTVNGSYMDDHFIGSNEGYTTYEGSVSVPLWLPGQEDATHDVAMSDANMASQKLAMSRLTLAIRLLDATTTLMLAHVRLTAMTNLRNATRHLSDLAIQSARAGETPNVDAALARAASRTAEDEWTQAKEAQNNAQNTLEILTGQPFLPDISVYLPSRLQYLSSARLERIIEEEPRVRAAHAALETARAALKLARRSYMPNPEVGIGAIHEKQYGSPWDTRVGVNITLTLPSEVRNTPIMMEATDRLATATSQEELARRMVKQELAQVRERMATASVERNILSDSANDLEHRAVAEERAWREGEHGFDVTLRARQDAVRAELARDQAEIAWHAAALRFLIATNAPL